VSLHSPGQRAEGEQCIEGDLVKGRAYLVLTTPGDAGRSYGVEAFNVLAVAVGAHSDSMAESLEREHLNEDADAAAVVSKEGGQGEGSGLRVVNEFQLFPPRESSYCRLLPPGLPGREVLPLIDQSHRQACSGVSAPAWWARILCSRFVVQPVYSVPSAQART
jgi:hypothetical protein